MSESNKDLDTSTTPTADERTYFSVPMSSLILGQLCERRLYVRLIKSSRYVLLVQPFTHLNESILDKLKKFDVIYSDCLSLDELFPALSQTARQVKIILDADLATFEKIAKLHVETLWIAETLNAVQTGNDIDNVVFALLRIFKACLDLPTSEMVAFAEDDDVVKTSELLKITALNTLFDLWAGTTIQSSLSQQFRNYWVYFSQSGFDPNNRVSHEDWITRLRAHTLLFSDVFDGVNIKYLQVETGGRSVSD